MTPLVQVTPASCRPHFWRYRGRLKNLILRTITVCYCIVLKCNSSYGQRGRKRQSGGQKQFAPWHRAMQNTYFPQSREGKDPKVRTSRIKQSSQTCNKQNIKVSRRFASWSKLAASSRWRLCEHVTCFASIDGWHFCQFRSFSVTKPNKSRKLSQW